MNARELIDAYRVKSCDNNRPYFCDDEELIDYIAEAQDEAAIRAKLIFDKDTAITSINISAGEATFKLSPLIIEVRRMAITDSDGFETVLTATNRDWLDARIPEWRSSSERPAFYCHDDNMVELSAIPDANYTLNIEAYRLPIRRIASEDDAPEIAIHHHRHLIDWVLYRAFEKQDGDLFDPNKSAQGLDRFERYFGIRNNANQRRNQRVKARNTPCL